MSAWRESRDPGWTQDIGYQLQEEAICGPISEAAVRAALTYILGVPDFPDFLYAPDEASAELTADVDNRNMAQMRKALEAARQAQVGFLVQEPP